MHPAVFRLDVHIVFSAAGMKLDLGIIICFTLCHIFSGNLSGVSGAGSDVIINSRVHKSKKKPDTVFVHVHANNSVWLHVPGSQ